jgi:hypothetical protein
LGDLDPAQGPHLRVAAGEEDVTVDLGRLSAVTPDQHVFVLFAGALDPIIARVFLRWILRCTVWSRASRFLVVLGSTLPSSLKLRADSSSL